MTEPNGRRPRRALNTWQFYGLLILSLVALIFVGQFFGAIDYGGDTPAFAPWLVAVVLIVSGVITLLMWRRLDEAAREAHKWAWYWGGSAGLVAVLALFLLGDRGFDIVASLGLTNSFESGIKAVLLLEVVSYLLAWAYWWLRRR
jgi:hypothetical protein